MPYSQFNIDRVKQDFHLNTVEGVRTAIQSSQSSTFNSSLRYCKQWNPMVISETRGANSHD
ncbi:hypothetical protein [Nostoc sp.]|uniref:hypothetical protein n=1 Tax=Nostoc sp. TaxID=1180 RepID=UPI002FFB0202